MMRNSCVPRAASVVFVLLVSALAFFGNTWSSNYPVTVGGTTNATQNLPIMMLHGGCVLSGTDIARPTDAWR